MEEIENVNGFVQNIDKLELPNQLVAVLADPLLQKLLVLRPSQESQQRIANWLNSVLQDVIDGDADETTLFDVLDILRDFVVPTKVCVTNLTFMSISLTLTDLTPAVAQLFCPLPTVMERDWPPRFNI